ncbi:MAG: asparagine synthase (glutamine-hydrolyzing) [Patescibacteria group bacterium]
MCGIAGIVNLDMKPVEKKILIKMTRALAHRGPDDEGFLIDKNIGLGHRRLSIIDLTASGHQPMFYDGRNLAIVYNGEIYNYLEIKNDLIKEGYKFRSKTDTEVILASYKKWGFDCLKYFNGMWAFVIYDKRKNLLFASRDRIGVKPLYYYKDKQNFIFASEPKAIIKHPKVKTRPNDKTIWDFLICGLVDHSENTFFDGIKELRPGHYIKIQNLKFPANAGMKIQKYWDLDPKKQPIYKKDQDYAEKFRELFIDSVRLRLRSDVPIGTCLSGGLDSSAIVLVVNNFLKEKIKIKQLGKWQKTFSSVFDDKKFPYCDESRFIKEAIKKTQAKPHYVFPSGQKLVSEIKKLVYFQDYPFSSTSIYAQWNVFRLAASSGIKVMLDGQGSDEFLAGYHPFFGIYYGQLLREYNLPRFIYEIFQYSRHHDYSLFLIFKDLFYDLLRKGFLGFNLPIFSKNQMEEYSLFCPEWQQKYQSPKALMPTGNVFKNGIHSGLKMGLPSLLKYEDRDSMAFSIESRVPFLDYRLMEFMYSLPDNQRIRHGQTKWVMRGALKGILPEKIRTRQDKIGFATPEEIWMRGGLGQDMKKIFSSEQFNRRGYFVPGKALEMFEKYLGGKIGNYQLFWRLYCLEMWFRVFID